MPSLRWRLLSKGAAFGLPAAKYWVSVFILAACFTFSAMGQTTSGEAGTPADTSRTEFINIRYADVFTYDMAEADTLQKLTGHVELSQDTLFLFCDSATILNSTYLTAQGNFVLQQGDSTTIFADSATYRSDSKVAGLFGNVSMLKGHQKLFTERLSYNTDTKIATYLTGATMTDDTTFLSSKRGYFHTSTDDIFFKDSVVVVSPDFTLRSDTLQFNTRTKVATFLAPALIVQDSARIYTEAGFYDIVNKNARFTKNPQYLKGSQKAWAEQMRYDGALKQVILIGRAHFKDDDTDATADIIRHTDATEITVLEGHAYIRDKDRVITGNSVTYDAKNGTYSTRGRSHIVDGTQVLDADRVDYDKSRDLGTASGNVVWQDTTEHITVVCHFAEHSKKKNYLKASGGNGPQGQGRPLLIKLIDGDSMYVSADTLMSLQRADLPAALSDSTAAAVPDSAAVAMRDTVLTAPVPILPDSLVAARKDSLGTEAPADSSRIILAFHEVRIFKSDLQAVCDSLTYTTSDSLFKLYGKPVIWSDTSQFTAGTVLMQLANDKIDRIFLNLNSFIVNSPDDVFFNQIKGKNSIAFFEEGELRRVKVVGNAESVYYARDDDEAYIGVNKIVCSEMMIMFGDNKVEGIRFYAEPAANLFPMKKADHNALKMPGFSWQIRRRPTSLDDLTAEKEAVTSGPSAGKAVEPEPAPGEEELAKPDVQGFRIRNKN
jgi:lipopolysaccharide export system protein LptA